MSIITSNGTGGGLASAGASWVGGIVPVEGDSVQILAGDAIELDGDYIWGDDTLTAITVAGTIIHSVLMSSSLTCKGEVIGQSGGWYIAGTEATPMPAAYTAHLVINYSESMLNDKYKASFQGGFNCSFVGDNSRRTVSKLVEGRVGTFSSFEVEDASGWQIGDMIEFPHLGVTVNYTNSRSIAITGVVGNVISIASISCVLPAGWHVANYEKNVKIRAYSTSFKTTVNMLHTRTTSDDLVRRTFIHVNVHDGIFGNGSPRRGLSIDYPHDYSPNVYKFEDCIFNAISGYNSYQALALIRCYAHYLDRHAFNILTIDDCLILQGGSTNWGASVILSIINSSVALYFTYSGSEISNSILLATWNGFGGSTGWTRATDVTFAHTSNKFFGTDFTNPILKRCKYAIDPSNSNSEIVSDANHYTTFMLNKLYRIGDIEYELKALDDRADPTFQWVRDNRGLRVRDTSIMATSVASIRFDPLNIDLPTTYKSESVVLSGNTVTASVQVRKNATLNGAIRPLLRIKSNEFDVTSVMAATNDAFETIAVTSPALVANQTVTVSVEAEGTIGSAWFDDLIIDGRIHDIGQSLFVGGTEISNVIDITDTTKHLSFTVTDSAGIPLTGYEWRIYESDASIGIIGLVELVGEEVAVSSSQDYAYNYTTDKPAVIQVINQPLNKEMLLDVTLLNQDQNFTLKLESQENI